MKTVFFRLTGVIVSIAISLYLNLIPHFGGFIETYGFPFQWRYKVLEGVIYDEKIGLPDEKNFGLLILNIVVFLSVSVVLWTFAQLIYRKIKKDK